MAEPSQIAQYLQRLEALAGQSETPLFDGFWQRVIIQPDLFCAQTFDVGIVVSHSGGGREFQLVEDLAKFECVYGRGHMKNIRDLLRVAEEVLFRAASFENLVSCTTGLGSSNVYLSKPQPTSGAKLEVVLKRLFAESVVMQPAEPKQARDSTGINTETARRLVGDELRRIGGLAYERIVVDTEKPVAIRDDEGDLHVLDVTLVTNTGAGNVVSGAYKTKATIEFSILKASQDVLTFSNIRRLKRPGLFILRPDAEHLTRNDFSGISEMLKEQEWHLKSLGFDVLSSDSPTPLAERILEWAGEDSAL